VQQRDRGVVEPVDPGGGELKIELRRRAPLDDEGDRVQRGMGAELERDRFWRGNVRDAEGQADRVSCAGAREQADA